MTAGFIAAIFIVAISVELGDVGEGGMHVEEEGAALVEVCQVP
jgi:hypothetical protein